MFISMKEPQFLVYIQRMNLSSWFILANEPSNPNWPDAVTPGLTPESDLARPPSLTWFDNVDL